MRLLFLLSVLLFSKPVFAQDCHIFDLTATVVDCANGQFFVVLNFQYDNVGDDGFHVQGNGQNYGNHSYDDVPLTLGPLPANGTTSYEFVVQDISHPDCQDVVQLGTVSCNTNPACEIFDLTVETGNCNNDGTYYVNVNFQVQNPTSDHFDLWANNAFYGNFPLSALPLAINNFPTNGGPNDVVKVCMNDNDDCCRVKEFPVPDCVGGGNCEIFDLTVQTGDCNNDGTYHATINFQVQNPGNDHFDLWANNAFYGNFALSALPLTIANFPTNGGPNDVVKVCINDNADCCRIKEFPVPDCVGGGNCEIFDLVVETGDCNDDGTYHATINFQVQNPGNSLFEVWANNQYLGFYPLTALPLHIAHFPTDGGPNDVIKVCINDHPDCCRIKEFPAPDCGDQEPCKISNITIETGDCNDDGTYHLTLNFQVQNPGNDQFDLWANNVYFGTFPLSSLPLHIEHFPTDGGDFDKVKICINDNLGCCKAKKFVPPYCPGNECKIFNLHVTTTPCVCGQFFALIQFRHKNGGPGGFDIMGNGQNYGNFPYSTDQPIVIGPLAGDGTTSYEFIVKDHENPDCHDEAVLGIVDCTQDLKPYTPAVASRNQQSSTSLRIAPNPAGERIQVSAQNPSGRFGQASVELYLPDGRLLRTETVAEGNSFSLDVAALPAGVYRVRVIGAGGTVQGNFVKQ